LAAANRARSRKLHDTSTTLSTLQSSMSNSNSNSNSGSFKFDFAPIASGSSSNNSKRMNLNLSSNSLDDSADSSFSGLAKKRTMDASKQSGESFIGSSFESSFDASFTASDSSLEWEAHEAFPRSKRSSATESTTSSSVDMSSEFVVLSAFQMIDDQQPIGEEVCDRDEGSETDRSDEDGDDESVGSLEKDDEEFAKVDLHEERATQAMLLAAYEEQFFAPSPRDSCVKRITGVRRPSWQTHLKDRNNSACNTPGNQAAELALCQHLARSGIDSGKSPRRGRARQRGGFRLQPSPLLPRRDSSHGSAMTENDVDALKSCRLRSQSRTPSQRPLSRAPSTRGQCIRATRDRSVSRDRSAATAPTACPESKLDQPLLGRAKGDESEEEDVDLWTCPWGGGHKATKDANHDIPIPILCFTKESSRAESVAQSRESSFSRSHIRHRASISGYKEQTTPALKIKVRRSIRATKVEHQKASPVSRTSSKRVSMKDVSARSNPEHRRFSLEERLGTLKDMSARSNPERNDRRVHRRHLADQESNEPGVLKQRRPSDCRPTKPRRSRSRAVAKATTAPPPLQQLTIQECDR
jgi:hypothetical protein